MSSTRALPTEGPSAGGGDDLEFGDLFDYEVAGEDDPFSDNYKTTSNPAVKEAAIAGESGAGLGIDEEVEITRKPRAPRVKLDEHKFVVCPIIRVVLMMQRLLSAAGIPRLRKRAKDQLKFKGKGHEVFIVLVFFCLDKAKTIR